MKKSSKKRQTWLDRNLKKNHAKKIKRNMTRKVSLEKTRAYNVAMRDIVIRQAIERLKEKNKGILEGNQEATPVQEFNQVAENEIKPVENPVENQ
jgi:hypothetical protein